MNLKKLIYKIANKNKGRSVEQWAISKGLNPKTLRLDLSAEDLMRLPIKYVTHKQLYEPMKGIYFNTINHYRHLIQIEDRECGHDNKFRYVLI